MRRLTLTQGTERERGASTIIVAVSFMVLLGFVGLAIDIGSAFAKRQEAQNGADAAALAVASQCLVNQTSENCPDDYASARSIALLNERTAATAYVEDGAIEYHTPEPYHVRVTVTAEQQSWFLPAIVTDHDAFTVRRSATVNYGSPVEGTVTLPLAAGNCIFPPAPMDPDDIVTVEIWLPPNSGSAAGLHNDCRPDFPSGGFAWLSGVNCTAEIGIDWTVPNDPGGPPPSACPGDRFRQMAINREIVHIPLFDVSDGSGAGAVYTVTRFAVFQVTGLHSQHGWVTDGPSSGWCTKPPDWMLNPSGGFNYNNTTCFKGNLLGFHDDPGDFELGGPITEITYLRMVG